MSAIINRPKINIIDSLIVEVKALNEDREIPNGTRGTVKINDVALRGVTEIYIRADQKGAPAIEMVCHRILEPELRVTEKLLYEASVKHALEKLVQDVEKQRFTIPLYAIRHFEFSSKTE